jgi:hypothetical protein
LSAGLIIYGDNSQKVHQHHIPGNDITISVMTVDVQGTASDIRKSVLSIAKEARNIARIATADPDLDDALN